jgi:hypothetical protein
MMRFDERRWAWLLSVTAAIAAVVFATALVIQRLASGWFLDLGISVSAVGYVVLAVAVLGAVAATFGGIFGLVVGLLRVVRWAVGVPAPRARPSHP